MYTPIKLALQTWLGNEVTEPRRLFHGRGHLHEGLEHINIDWYPPLLLITAYDKIHHVADLTGIVRGADAQNQVESVMLQHRYKKGAPAEVLQGEDLHCFVVREDDLLFEVHPGVQQNTGLFLDMRLLREWLRQSSDDRNVLNLFAYTCSLSVAALAGGARQVVNVDMSKPSIRWGERNHTLNRQDLRAVRSIAHNVFRSWGRIRQYGPYNTVIIDPPARQRGSFEAEKNYGSLLKKLQQLTLPSADIIATVNSPYLGPDFLIHQVQRYAPACRFVEEIAAAPEFADRFPDKALKICRFKVS
jgi:23S rRNA (cytosine1962-C5)-methyltransferase